MLGEQFVKFAFVVVVAQEVVQFHARLHGVHHVFLGALFANRAVHVQRRLVHGAERGQRIKDHAGAGVAELLAGEQRRGAEFGDVGQQRRAAEPFGERLVVFQGVHRLGEDAVGARFQAGPGAIDRRVQEIIDGLPFAFLGGNIYDAEWNEPAFDAYKVFERGGVRIAVLGQAFPYTPIANPRWMFPNWSFGIREEDVASNVEAARADGADLIVLLSHNGFDVDRKLAARVPGIDVILTAHTHDALPEPVVVGKTLLIASGSHGKFVTRLDLDVGGGEMKGFRHRLIPVFSDVIAPDADMTRLVGDLRAPFEAELKRELATTETLLYRRGNFNGTFDDMICQALLDVREADIALSPGFRWGTSVLPGQTITTEDLYNACGMTYPAAYRSMMTGQMLKDILEDVADNLFNPDPYYQQGGDMVRVGGMGYSINPDAAMGSRISSMTMLKTGEAVDPAKEYAVAGWASINEATEGPPIWDVVETWLAANPIVSLPENRSVKIIG